MGEEFELCMSELRVFDPLLNMRAGRGEKANMADTGPHQLEAWTLPLAFSTCEILREDF